MARDRYGPNPVRRLVEKAYKVAGEPIPDFGLVPDPEPHPLAVIPSAEDYPGDPDVAPLPMSKYRKMIFERYTNGKTFTAIAEELGTTIHTVVAHFGRACEDFPLPDIDVFRRRQLAEIQQAKWTLLDILHRSHVVVSEGQIVKREIENPFGGESEWIELEDSDPLIRVASVLKGLWERESKLIGGDAPIKVESKNMHVHFSVEGVDVNELR